MTTENHIVEFSKMHFKDFGALFEELCSSKCVRHDDLRVQTYWKRLKDCGMLRQTLEKAILESYYMDFKKEIPRMPHLSELFDLSKQLCRREENRLISEYHDIKWKEEIRKLQEEIQEEREKSQEK